MFRCELCDRWFCERHLRPRLAFIKNFDAIENIPEVRALYFAESEGLKSEDGHPDFEFSRRKFAELDIEEKRRSELIKQALDRMNERYRERKESRSRIERVSAEIQNTFVTDRETTTTFGNIFKYRFNVPADVYSDEKYGEKLNRARTLSEVDKIIKDYRIEKGDSVRIADTEKHRRHFHISVVGLAVSVLLFFAGLGLYLYSSRDIYLIFIIPFIPFPIPFWVVGIGLMIFGVLGFIASLK